jgi:hypothetical protein
MPTLVAVATGIRSPFIGALVVSALMFTAAIMVFALRGLSPQRLVSMAALAMAAGVAVTLGGIHMQSAVVMIGGTMLAGVGFGAAYAGILRTLLPMAGAHERAGLLAAYFVESYLIFAVPAIIAGLAAPVLGLVWTGEIYGMVLIALNGLSLLAAAERPAVQPRLG